MTQQNNWEKEFYELTATLDGQLRPPLKLLISTQIAKAREEGESIRDIDVQGFSAGVKQERARIIKLIERMKRKLDELGEIEGNDTAEMHYDRDTGYNSALSDLITAITEEGV